MNRGVSIYMQILWGVCNCKHAFLIVMVEGNLKLKVTQMKYFRIPRVK